MAYTIKNYGKMSEVLDENGRVIYMGTDEACMDWCDENEWKSNVREVENDK